MNLKTYLYNVFYVYDIKTLSKPNVLALNAKLATSSPCLNRSKKILEETNNIHIVKITKVKN